MTALEGPFAAACCLLVLAGGYKLARPAPTAGALRAVRWPSGLRLVRTLGAGELVLGATAVVSGNAALAALLAAAYATFAAFVVVALRSGSAIQSCGCFGETDTPPSALHVVTNLVLAGVAAAVAIGGVPPLIDVLRDQPGAGVPFLVLVAVTVQLVYVMLTDLPRALRPAHPGRA